MANELLSGAFCDAYTWACGQQEVNNPFIHGHGFITISGDKEITHNDFIPKISTIQNIPREDQQITFL